MVGTPPPSSQAGGVVGGLIGRRVLPLVGDGIGGAYLFAATALRLFRLPMR
jgi:hypothetical protein